ncbi:MAG: hypothetical protein WED07_16550 [Candidatus Freyarchaeum deiterrae]
MASWIDGSNVQSAVCGYRRVAGPTGSPSLCPWRVRRYRMSVLLLLPAGGTLRRTVLPTAHGGFGHRECCNYACDAELYDSGHRSLRYCKWRLPRGVKPGQDGHVP